MLPYVSICIYIPLCIIYIYWRIQESVRDHLCRGHSFAKEGACTDFWLLCMGDVGPALSPGNTLESRHFAVGMGGFTVSYSDP